MGNTPRITEEQRQLVHRLINVERRTIADTIKLCAHGIYGIEAFEIGKTRVSEIARDGRVGAGQLLGDQPVAELFDKAVRDGVMLVLTEFEREAANSRPLDCDNLAKLARALRDLQPLAKPGSTEAMSKQTFLTALNPEQSATKQETSESDSSSASTDLSLPLAA